MTGEQRLELAEHQRDQQRLEQSIQEKCYGCVAGYDETVQIPEDAERFAGKYACGYHWPDELGPFPLNTN